MIHNGMVSVKKKKKELNIKDLMVGLQLQRIRYGSARKMTATDIVRHDGKSRRRSLAWYIPHANARLLYESLTSRTFAVSLLICMEQYATQNIIYVGGNRHRIELGRNAY